MNIFKFLFRKKNKPPKKVNGFSIVEYYEIRPIHDMIDNLKYMHCEIIYEDIDVTILAKEYKDIMYKYVIVNNFNNYLTKYISNELLVSYNLGREFKYKLIIEHLGKIPMIEIVIFKEQTPDTVKYCFKNPIQNNKLYQMYLTYDNEYIKLNQFKYGPTYGSLYKNFKIAMYHDINAIDRENY